MATTSDRLSLLLRTKQLQRAELERRYPELNFDTIPFRAYLDLFQGRSYVPGFVGGWKAYGRSNDEDASTRDFLPDYSGNGRDIKLYNFAFTGMSGYGESVDDFSGMTFYDDRSDARLDGNTIHVDNIKANPSSADYGTVICEYVGSPYSGTRSSYSVRVSGVSGNDITVYHRYVKDSASVLFGMSEDGVYVLPEIPEGAGWVGFTLKGVRSGDTCNITIEQLPVYPGALVSDGVDDYGKCIKGFALPDDYTVVAIRQFLPANNNADSALVSKSGAADEGAFIMEYNYGTSTYSYGQNTPVPNGVKPALFTYQTRTSYNGSAIIPGSGADTAEDILTLFCKRESGYQRMGAALYDLRIYDHSLTAEELQAVKDEMMTDYMEATGGGLNDIHYVADWDAKGRSNDEEETMRSQWIDKAAGKVLNLNNYAYAGMSGWNGYAEDFTTFDTTIPSAMITSNKVTATIRYKDNWILQRNSAMDTIEPMVVRIRVDSSRILYYYIPSDNTAIRKAIEIQKDGIYSLPGSVLFTGETLDYVGFYVPTEYETEKEVVIEQLPLYPGALVSDGVDDSGKASEALGAVGSMLIHWRDLGLSNGGYVYNTGFDDDTGRLYLWKEIASDTIVAGLPTQSIGFGPLSIYTREPLVSIVPLNLMPSNHTVIFRLIFIEEQLDDAQQEFLKWKVDKEYRDWCKANGYDYAINDE